MTWPVVIKTGPNLHQTLATVQYDRYGDKTNQEIFICDNWIQGFEWAKKSGHEQSLFVDSGTIIKDWKKFSELINQYPHNGLIGHLIWHPGGALHLNDQCWFMNLDQFETNDFCITEVSHPCAVRSEQNLHDDYTPLWIRPGNEIINTTVTEFGQGLIARQLANKLPVVNWNNSARDLKIYMYNDQVDWSVFQEYKNIAENQLWIFNNEPVSVVKKPCLVTPGSGLFWMLNLVDDATKELHIVDISQAQIKFCQTLWQTWDGQDYGQVAWNFIQDNNIVHFQVDNPHLTPLERLYLKSKTKFIDYVNQTFEKSVPSNFEQLWKYAQKNKQINFYNTSLIPWVLNNTQVEYDYIWESNIFDYKWTLLHSTPGQYNEYRAKVK